MNKLPTNDPADDNVDSGLTGSIAPTNKSGKTSEVLESAIQDVDMSNECRIKTEMLVQEKMLTLWHNDCLARNRVRLELCQHFATKSLMHIRISSIIDHSHS